MKNGFISLKELKASAFTASTLESEDRLLRDSAVKPMSESDIAIIGMSGKFGEANDLRAFWEVLLKGKECIREIPLHRKADADRYLEFSGGKSPHEDTQYTRIAYLDEIDKFDCGFFGILPNEAKLIDPRQRLFLESAWSTLEDAGYGGGKLCGSKTGVYVGLSSDGSNEYFKLIEQGDPSLIGLSTAGNIKSVIAGRLAYILDFKGPSMMIDTACSSSLVALHVACQAIKNHECEAALVGGVNIKIFPKTEEENNLNIGITSSDSSIRTFDDQADGTNSGEGVAAVLIKPLDKAIRDRDHIYAVIKGSAVNQDGSSVGITAPNMTAQENVITDAWKEARIDPQTVTYWEAHGTGTKLGDPIEVHAIHRAFNRFTDRKQFCAIGSVKTNIGHLDSLAGLAGLIKAVMAIQYRKIPPSLHFKVPNRNIQFSSSPVYVNDQTTDWKGYDGVYRCGISSFGLSGTNAHVVLEGPPPLEQRQDEVPANHIFTVSAKTEASLEKLILNYLEFLGKEQELRISDLCYTVNTGRLPNQCRIAMIVSSTEELIRKLKLLARNGAGTYKAEDIYYRKLERNLKFIGKSMTGSGGLTESSHKSIADLQLLCGAYCDGADMDFEGIYRQLDCRKVSWPTYAFEQKRLWVELPESRRSLTAARTRHPLLQERAVSSLNLEVYVSYLNVQDFWVLNEHQVNDACVIPGTAYLDMAKEIGTRHFGEARDIILSDVSFLNLLKVEKDEVKEIHTIVNIKDDALKFTVASRASAAEEWIKHAEAWIGRKERQPHTTYDIETLKTTYDSVYAIRRNQSWPVIEESSYTSVQYVEDTNRPESIINVGGRWKCTNAIYRSKEGVLCELEIQAEYAEDLEQFYLHPAMMDCAVNAGTFTINEDTYLPYYYKEFRIFGPTPKKFYSYITKKNNENEETGKFDLLLLNEQGEVFGEISSYIVKRVHSFTPLEQPSAQKSIYHKLGWVEKNEYKLLRRSEANGGILLFHNQAKLAGEIIASLRQAGKKVIEAIPGQAFSERGEQAYSLGGRQEDYDKLFAAIELQKISQIIHLMTIQDHSAEGGHQQLEYNLKLGLDSLFYLSQSIMKHPNDPVELVLFAEHVHRISGSETAVNPHHAAFFGLGKVLGKEYSKLNVRCIDIDGETRAAECIREINGEKQVELVGYREGRPYVQELQAVPVPALPDQQAEIKKDGVYIITGGLGGLGLEVARYLSSLAKVNLILVGRSGLSHPIDPGSKNHTRTEIMNHIRANGSNVDCYQADVADEREMQAMLAQLRQRYTSINGIFHCAGVAGEGFIFRKDKAAFDRVTRPKIQGTRILDKLTAEDKLDFFVMFSSITSLSGSMGQADYTAANAYLDSYAEYRSLIKPEQKTLTINWCGWKDTGMLADYRNKLGKEAGTEENQNEQGFKNIGTREAIEALNVVLNKEISKVIIGELDDKVFGLYKDQITFSLAPEIAARIRPTRPKAPGHTGLPPVPMEHRDYSGIESAIVKAWVKVLGLEQININDKFYDLGGDSISAIYLVKEIGKVFPSLIDISDIFTYPSISEMSDYIQSLLEDRNGHAAGSVQPVTSEEETEEDLDGILSKLASGELEVSEANQLLYSGQKS
ncbi:type I polyketide synthase [Paenibacillus riograndensis]|uniref:Beta-ketoacyl synthase n=2 Tax=Paenibacillus riograndensis TaxID=483937 RepID=A0A0E4CZ51_9BACL|nr:type I polyketide synthase [Paenibacillus riograndensis]CQR58211.1 Beta-ketoacyl synthase [Paenibacillus riograndensis SBR5]